jgi:hypothetical protein
MPNTEAPPARSIELKSSNETLQSARIPLFCFMLCPAFLKIFRRGFEITVPDPLQRQEKLKDVHWSIQSDILMLKLNLLNTRIPITCEYRFSLKASTQTDTGRQRGLPYIHTDRGTIYTDRVTIHIDRVIIHIDRVTMHTDRQGYHTFWQTGLPHTYTDGYHTYIQSYHTYWQTGLPYTYTETVTTHTNDRGTTYPSQKKRTFITYRS